MEPIFPANPIEKVGYYGGRIAPGLLGEPLNLATDIGFIIFICIFYAILRKRGISDKPVLILVILAGLIGLGSAIFHSHPTRMTLQIDLIPITIFGLAYIFFSMCRFFNQTYKVSLLVTLLFMLFATAFESIVKDLKIPGMNHIPSILALGIMGILLLKRRIHAKVGKAFMMASFFYIVALLFRYLDLFIFRAFPLGTHFLWHASTSCVVGILLYASATYGRIHHHPGGMRSRP